MMKNRKAIDRTIIEEFLYYMEDYRELAANTIKNYKIDLDMLFDFLENNNVFDVKDVNIKHLHSFIFDRNKKGDAKSTRARRISTIKSFFRYINKISELIEINPAIDLETPKLDETNPEYLTLEEAQHLIQSIDTPYKIRDTAIIVTFLNTGLRLSELTSINISDIKGDKLTIKGKGGKERVIYLNDMALNAINKYLKVRPESDTDALFVSERKRRINISTVQKMVKQNLEYANIDTNKISTHKFRHTAATLMHKYGNVDIFTLKEVLGHASVKTTERYTHVDNEELRNAIKSNPLNQS